mgnify:CR=1 FL=1
MGKLKFLFLTIVALCALSCAKSEPPVALVEYAQACDAANNDKRIAVQGFLNAVGTTPCLKFMKIGKNGASTRECGFKLLDKVNITGNEIIVYVTEGKERSQVETPDAGLDNVKPTSTFARENLKLRLDDGTEVAPQESVATPVRVTGEISLTDKSDGTGGKNCSLHASKVEKR